MPKFHVLSVGYLERGEISCSRQKKKNKNGRRVPEIQRHLEEGKRGVSKTVNKRGRYLVVPLYFNRNKQYRMGGMLKFFFFFFFFCNGFVEF